MSEVELKPCPFCGQDRVSVQTDRYYAVTGYVTYAFVVCPSCGAQGPIEQRGLSSAEQCRVNAMKAWERRK